MWYPEDGWDYAVINHTISYYIRSALWWVESTNVGLVVTTYNQGNKLISCCYLANYKVVSSFYKVIATAYCKLLQACNKLFIIYIGV